MSGRRQKREAGVDRQAEADGELLRLIEIAEQYAAASARISAMHGARIDAVHAGGDKGARRARQTESSAIRGLHRPAVEADDAV
ncbi:hypothetical protein Ms3S1_13220 [Methylosinus sp. 3S-1]